MTATLYFNTASSERTNIQDFCFTNNKDYTWKHFKPDNYENNPIHGTHGILLPADDGNHPTDGACPIVHQAMERCGTGSKKRLATNRDSINRKNSPQSGTGTKCPTIAKGNRMP